MPVSTPVREAEQIGDATQPWVNRIPCAASLSRLGGGNGLSQLVGDRAAAAGEVSPPTIVDKHKEDVGPQARQRRHRQTRPGKGAKKQLAYACWVYGKIKSKAAPWEYPQMRIAGRGRDAFHSPPFSSLAIPANERNSAATSRFCGWPACANARGVCCRCS